jgi:hypothetical protein
MKTVFSPRKIVALALMAAVATASLIGESKDVNKVEKSAELTRLMQAMAKLRRGETIAVVALGGSITTGYAAKPPSEKGWAALVGEWWESKARDCGGTVMYYNEGVSGTDSAFAAARVADHVLANFADVVFLEFAINDQWLSPNVRKRSYEGVIRQMLAGSDRAVVCLFLNERSSPAKGQGAEQAPIAARYGLPRVSWADSLAPLLASGAASWDAMFDGQEEIHPNDSGHASIGRCLTDFLDSVWGSLPADDEIPQVERSLPEPLYGDDFQFVKLYGSSDIAPLANSGWTRGSDEHPEWRAHGGSKQGWSCKAEGAEMSFALKGESIGLMYAESDQYRDAEAWVEYPDGTKTRPVNLECYVSYRSGYLGWAYREIAHSPEARDCVLHVRLKKSRSSDSGKLGDIVGILATGAL